MPCKTALYVRRSVKAVRRKNKEQNRPYSLSTNTAGSASPLLLK